MLAPDFQLVRITRGGNLSAMSETPIEQQTADGPPPETQRSVFDLLASDLNTVVTSVAAGVATGVAVARIIKGQEPGPPKADPPPQQDSAE